MRKREMLDLVYVALAEALAGTSFRLKRSEEGFVRDTPGGRQVLGVPFWDYTPDFEFSLNVCIRLDAAEEILNRVSGTPAKYHSMSFTTVTRLDHFTDGGRAFKVRTAEDVIEAFSTLSGVVRQRIVPFFDTHTDAVALDKAVNGEDGNIDITQYPWRAAHAIILAKLARNPDFERIIETQRQAMGLPPGVPHPINELVARLADAKPGGFGTET